MAHSLILYVPTPACDVDLVYVWQVVGALKELASTTRIGSAMVECIAKFLFDKQKSAREMAWIIWSKNSKQWRRVITITSCKMKRAAFVVPWGTIRARAGIRYIFEGEEWCNGPACHATVRLVLGSNEQQILAANYSLTDSASLGVTWKDGEWREEQ